MVLVRALEILIGSDASTLFQGIEHGTRRETGVHERSKRGHHGRVHQLWEVTYSEEYDNEPRFTLRPRWLWARH